MRFRHDENIGIILVEKIGKNNSNNEKDNSGNNKNSSWANKDVKKEKCKKKWILEKVLGLESST